MKILISDLDGTIYRNKKVSFQDINALNKFTNSNMLVIATGRNSNTFSFFANQYKLAYTYVILCNGALIQDQNQQTILKHAFKQNEDISRIFKILDLFKDESICVSLSFENSTFYIPKWKSESYEHVMANLEYEVIGICLEIIDKNETIINAIYKQLLKITTFNIEKNNQYIDILPEGVSKKSAIEELIDINKWDKDSIHVIGDSYNDLSMFEINDNSFMINNNIEELNSNANNVVDSISDCIAMINNE